MEDLLTIEEVAEILRLKLLTVYRWVESGKIRGIKIGKGWRFKKSEIDRFLKDQESQGYHDTAVKLYQQGKINEAVIALKESINIYSQKADSYTLLSEIYLEKSKKDKEYIPLIEKILKQLLDLDPDNLEVISKLKNLPSLHETIAIANQDDVCAKIKNLIQPIMKTLTVHEDNGVFEEAYKTANLLSKMVEEKDAYLSGHSEKRSVYVAAIAHELGLSRIQTRALQIAAFIYDVGKLYIDEQILKKPGKLTEMEINTIRSHPVIGEKILRDVGMPEDILKCVRHHHESLDGKGYPDGLKGEDIPIGARIIKVVDAFGAMVSLRPYREPLSFEGALDELRSGGGNNFDLRVIDAFAGAIAEERNLFKIPSRKNVKSKRILIVDDEPWTAGAVRGSLEMEGFDAITSPTGESALQKIYEVKPDMVILDVFLPDMDCHSLCRRLSQDSRTTQIPIIVISTAGTIEDEIAILESGADDYLTKPFNLRELVARINAHLRRIDHENDVNPLTGLSGASCIESVILKRISDPSKRLGMLRVDLDNLKAFNDVYGLLHGDKVIKLVADVLQDVIKTSGNEDDFIGHIGGDNFVIITSQDNVEMIRKRITSEFNRRIPACYHKDDVERGYILRDKERCSLLSMSIGCATNRDRNIHNYQDFERIVNEEMVCVKK
ncbi:MAG: HD domain-containing phosphohydrolase [Candidatus Desantisbacteria bacterium]